jgi:hypothetical protein
VPVAFAMVALLPLMARQEMSPAARRFSIRLSLLVAFGAALVAGFQQPYSNSQPEWLNLRYVEHDGKAWWMADPMGPLPHSLRGAAHFSASPQQLAAWQGYVAPAGTAQLPAPKARVTRSGHRVTLDLEGSPNASGMALILPDGLAAVRINDVPVAGNPKYLVCATPDCAAAHVVLEFRGDAPERLMLAEEHFGLPAKAAPLLKARPSWAVPSGQGDVTVVAADIGIPAL